LYRHVFNRMIKIQKRISKPFAFCLPSIADSIELAKKFNGVKKNLHKNRVLYFFSLKEAAKSISLFCDYCDYLNFGR